MKNISIITAVLFMLSVNLFSQNKEPDKMRFAYDHIADPSNTFDFDIKNLPQTKFMLGWQWGGHSFN